MHLVAKIMLLSVVSAKAATLCHQIQSRQVNLGSVVCRSIHSTTHDLAKPSSQRRDLCRSDAVSARSEPGYLLCSRSVVVPAELGRIHPHAMEHDAQLAGKGHLGALHAPAFGHVESPVFKA